jgi:hypothetical protein
MLAYRDADHLLYTTERGDVVMPVCWKDSVFYLAHIDDTTVTSAIGNRAAKLIPF